LRRGVRRTAVTVYRGVARDRSRDPRHANRSLCGSPECEHLAACRSVRPLPIAPCRPRWSAAAPTRRATSGARRLLGGAVFRPAPPRPRASARRQGRSSPDLAPPQVSGGPPMTVAMPKQAGPGRGARMRPWRRNAAQCWSKNSRADLRASHHSAGWQPNRRSIPDNRPDDPAGDRTPRRFAAARGRRSRPGRAVVSRPISSSQTRVRTSASVSRGPVGCPVGGSGPSRALAQRSRLGRVRVLRSGNRPRQDSWIRTW